MQMGSDFMPYPVGTVYYTRAQKTLRKKRGPYYVLFNLNVM